MSFLKKHGFLLISIIVLFSFFKTETKEGIPYDYVSESLIIGRMMESERSGIVSYSGLPGVLTNHSNDEDFKQNAITQFHLLENKSDRKKFSDFKTYNSQTGGQGILYSAFHKFSPFDLKTNIKILKNFTFLLNAIILSIIIGWCKRNFGTIAALFVLVFIAISSWIGLFTNSLWWCLWAFYLPFTTILLGLEFLKKEPKKIFLLLFLSIFLKCFFNGFEYITTTLIAVFAPVVYYYLKDKKTIKDFIFFSLKASGVLLLGVLLEMVLLIFQLKQLKGSFTDGIHHIVNSYNTRTASVIIEGKTAEISNNMYVQIIIKYLSGDLFSWLKFKIPFILPITLIFAACLILLKINFKKYKPIVFATWFSILAPLSWFFLFIQHSTNHLHLNYVIWYIPFLPLGIVCLGILATILWKDWLKVFPNKN